MVLLHSMSLYNIADMPIGRSQEETSVHPLGGANMSCDGSGKEGVTNHLGEVFCGTGNDVHHGLVCCDGSVVPSSLGKSHENLYCYCKTD